MEPKDIIGIARREVSKTLLRHPEWAHWRDDLVQDVCEAIITVLRKRTDLRNPGGYARIRARGETIRSALSYAGFQFGRTRATDVRPEFESTEILASQEAPDTFGAVETELAVRSLVRWTGANIGPRSGEVLERSFRGLEPARSKVVTRLRALVREAA